MPDRRTPYTLDEIMEVAQSDVLQARAMFNASVTFRKSDRQPAEAIPATPDPRAEAERLLSAHGAQIRKMKREQATARRLEVQLADCVCALLAALSAKDEELRSLREASAGAPRCSRCKNAWNGVCQFCAAESAGAPAATSQEHEK